MKAYFLNLLMIIYHMILSERIQQTETIIYISLKVIYIYIYIYIYSLTHIDLCTHFF